MTAAGATLLAPAVARAAAPSWTFRGVSGRLVVGLLVTTDPWRHEAALVALRRASAYARPLSYVSTDRLKVGFAEAVIDYVAEADDLAFTYSGRYRADTRVASPGKFPELDQVASFLAGCAYGHHMGTDHPVKRALVGRLRERTSLLA
jgi:hypothetical protein